jgi:hypothetical protein
MSTYLLGYLSVRDICHIRNILYNNGQKYQPPLPKTTEEVMDTLNTVSIQTIREDFVFICNQHIKIVVFDKYSLPTLFM